MLPGWQDCPTIAESTFSDNKASRGGAIFQAGGLLNITDSRLVENSATSTGGSIYASAADLNIRNVTLLGNVASELPNLFPDL